jgi:hypothetical protein
VPRTSGSSGGLNRLAGSGKVRSGGRAQKGTAPAWTQTLPASPCEKAATRGELNGPLAAPERRRSIAGVLVLEETLAQAVLSLH